MCSGGLRKVGDHRFIRNRIAGQNAPYYRGCSYTNYTIRLVETKRDACPVIPLSSTPNAQLEIRLPRYPPSICCSPQRRRSRCLERDKTNLVVWTRVVRGASGSSSTACLWASWPHITAGVVTHRGAGGWQHHCPSALLKSEQKKAPDSGWPLDTNSSPHLPKQSTSPSPSLSPSSPSLLPSSSWWWLFVGPHPRDKTRRASSPRPVTFSVVGTVTEGESIGHLATREHQQCRPSSSSERLQ
jgi:hypothetical protein